MLLNRVLVQVPYKLTHQASKAFNGNEFVSVFSKLLKSVVSIPLIIHQPLTLSSIYLLSNFNGIFKERSI
ncbi:hypothetical protein [Proteus phage RP7]|nr:hypothetical protein [Proteus phage RP7]